MSFWFWDWVKWINSLVKNGMFILFGLGIVFVLLFIYFLLNYWIVSFFFKVNLFIIIFKIVIFGLIIGLFLFVGFYSGNFMFEEGIVLNGWVSVLMVVVMFGIVFVFNGF